MRRTKIVATLGPSTDTVAQLERLISAGVNVVRLNFSHGEGADHSLRAERVLKIAQSLGRSVAILGDLQGPKIRIGRFKTGEALLAVGAPCILDSDFSVDLGDQTKVGLVYKDLPNDCIVGDVLLIDDGRLSLKVKSIDKTRVVTEVLIGGKISNNKGLNRLGGGLSAPALTDKDRKDIQLAADIGVDYLAVSFVRNPQDVEETRELLKEAGCTTAGIIAKLERAEVVHSEVLLSSVIQASDAVMVARGDLGVEIGDAELIGVQKRVIAEARRLNKPVITATQMMESMISNSQPTRAEVFDVANAVLDGTDAVMLSAETASGERPDEVVGAMNRICLGAEKHPTATLSSHRINATFTEVDESIAMSAMYAANHMQGVKAIVCLTKTGTTPLLMSRINTHLPIVAMTRHRVTERRVALYRGVQSIYFDAGSGDDVRGTEVNERIVAKLKKADLIKSGDKIILTRGDLCAAQNGTCMLQIVTVE